MINNAVKEIQDQEVDLLNQPGVLATFPSPNINPPIRPHFDFFHFRQEQYGQVEISNEMGFIQTKQAPALYCQFCKADLMLFQSYFLNVEVSK